MALTVHLPDVLQRARAAFLGLAIGDALGASVEFLTPSEIRSAYGVHRDIVGGGWLHLKAGRVTDDTEMSLCIARAIDVEGGWSLRRVAENFAAWVRACPVDVGNTCLAGVRRFIHKGTLQVPPGDWHGGNGAAMRMVPVALFTLGDTALLEQYTLEQARLTHHHPLSDAGTFLVGRLIHQAILGLSLSRMRASAEDLVARHPQFKFEPYPGRATGYVVDTMQTVLHHLFATRSFEECLVGVVNQGDDADTTGAIAGGIAGAYYGLEAIPRRWLERLDWRVHDEAEVLAERLVQLSPVGRGVPVLEY